MAGPLSCRVTYPKSRMRGLRLRQMLRCSYVTEAECTARAIMSRTINGRPD